MALTPKFKTTAFRLAISLSLLAGTCLSGHSAWAAVTNEDEAPIDFAASNVEYDEINQIVIASGAVEIEQQGRIVKADRITYDLKTEKVNADGNVALMETNGDVHFADRFELKDKMKDGYVKKLRSVLADGSRFTAEEGERVDGKRVIMKNASYTPCEPCKAHPEKPPAWQIKADRVVHDEVKKTITYKNATFEGGGVPLMYIPYFSHPDGTVKQQSGFLPPSFSLDSGLGFSATPNYYWAIDPSQDATFGMRVFSEQAPQALVEYRKRFEKANLFLSGSTTYSDRTDSVGDEDVKKGEELRGHFKGHGLWEITNKIRAGFNSEVASDDQYMRQYDISGEDVLENEAYVERFSGRDYADIRALAFQDLRISDRAGDQPNILPEAHASFLGEPDSILGGRMSLDLSALGLTRDGNGQDVLRGSAKTGWERRDIFDFGLVNRFSASVRGDVYNIPKRDEDLLGAGGEGDSRSSRIYPVLHNVTSYPMINNFEDYQAVIEPTVAFTAATRSKNKSEIPNEDSQDVQIDALNVFEPNRFPGLDRVEDRSHVTYGLRTGVYDYEGSQGEIFLGQSYRFDDNNNPFPEGSGLDTQSSDYVGSLRLDYLDMLNFDYRFQLASENFGSQKHEVNLSSSFEDFGGQLDYIYARGLEGTDLIESREQVAGSVYYDFAEEWRARTGARYDIQEEGIREIVLGLDYLGQCITTSLTAQREYTEEASGDNDLSVMLRVGLKNLGEFGND